MLESLRITNLAIIEELSIEFGPGFTVLTGETGAGKSVLVDAINLILGGRASSELIRTGADHASVEAIFQLEPEVREVAEQAGVSFGEGDELLVKRVFSRGGKNKVHLNGGPATLAMLEAISPRLIDIAGQHEHQTLLVPESHRAVVDAAGSSGQALENMRETFSQLREVQRRVRELEERDASRARRQDYLRFQVEELRAADLQEGEEQSLLLERQRLLQTEALDEAVTRSEEELYSGDSAVSARLKLVHGHLVAAARIDPSLGSQAATLEAARLELEDVGRTLRDYRRLEASPERSGQIEERLAQIERLRKKHGCGDVAALQSLQQTLERELDELDSIETVLRTALEGQSAAEGKARKAADRLSVERRKTAVWIGRRVANELHSLGMTHTRFEVGMQPVELSASGAESIEFLISPNPGEELKSLSRTASGGELSRVMLALKRVIAEHHPVATYVFDEVDAGIGGGIAARVGQVLRGVANGRHQVLCVTHLPQIAVLADEHIQVTKSVAAGRTRIAVTPLSEAARENEVARMLGGLEITPATRAHAREMLRRRAKPGRLNSHTTDAHP